MNTQNILYRVMCDAEREGCGLVGFIFTIFPSLSSVLGFQLVIGVQNLKVKRDVNKLLRNTLKARKAGIPFGL